MTHAESSSPEEDDRVRRSFIAAVQAALDRPGQSSVKWDSLYEWFDVELGVPWTKGTDTKQCLVVGKLVRGKKQAANRRAEMESYYKKAKYAVISVAGGVSTDDMLNVMRDSTSLPCLEMVLFLEEARPARLVIFDD
jgi:hypothetical protein